MSDNIRWAVNKKFEKGQFSLPYSCFLGYDKGPDGRPVINEEQAKIVREIYHRFLAGESPYCICKALESKGIKAPRGGSEWSKTTIVSILSNEKYAGNAILQKSFTADFLTKKKQVNNGEVPKYYVQDSHEAIVTQEEFDLVQAELKERKDMMSSAYSSSVFSGKILCGTCGSVFGAKTWHSTDSYRSTVFRCNRRYVPGKKECDSPHIAEKKLKKLLTEAINQFLVNRDSFLDSAKLLEEKLFNTKELDSKKAKLDIEVEAMKDLYRKEVSGKVIRDSGRLNEIQESYSQKLEERDSISAEITSRKRKVLELKRMAKQLTTTPKVLTEFSDQAFIGLVDHVTVFQGNKLTITFRNGYDISMDFEQSLSI